MTSLHLSSYLSSVLFVYYLKSSLLNSHGTASVFKWLRASSSYGIVSFLTEMRVANLLGSRNSEIIRLIILNFLLCAMSRSEILVCILFFFQISVVEHYSVLITTVTT